MSYYHQTDHIYAQVEFYPFGRFVRVVFFEHTEIPEVVMGRARP